MGKEKFEDICVQNLSAKHFGKYVSGKLKVFSMARCCTEFTESPDFLFEINNEYYGVEHFVIDLLYKSILIGVIGVGIFCIIAKLCSAYFSLVRLINSSNVEPLNPLEFQVGIRVYFLSFLPAVCNKFYVLRESLFSDSLLLIYLHCSLAGGCSRNP